MSVAWGPQRMPMETLRARGRAELLEKVGDACCTVRQLQVIHGGPSPAREFSVSKPALVYSCRISLVLPDAEMGARYVSSSEGEVQRCTSQEASHPLTPRLAIDQELGNVQRLISKPLFNRAAKQIWSLWRSAMPCTKIWRGKMLWNLLKRKREMGAGHININAGVETGGIEEHVPSMLCDVLVMSRTPFHAIFLVISSHL